MDAGLMHGVSWALQVFSFHICFLELEVEETEFIYSPVFTVGRGATKRKNIAGSWKASRGVG